MATIIKRRGAKGVSYRAQVRRNAYSSKTQTLGTEQQAKDWFFDEERDIRDRKMGLRQFSMRGLDKVAGEWTLATLA